jgi:Holliday junction resolvase RusA-like endonuclease
MYPTNPPDATKLLRSTEDALTGIVWKDDKLIVDQLVSKNYQRPGIYPGAKITVSVFERTEDLFHEGNKQIQPDRSKTN